MILFFFFKDELIAELRTALSQSEKRNEEINREFQKLLRQKEVHCCFSFVFKLTCRFLLFVSGHRRKILVDQGNYSHS